MKLEKLSDNKIRCILSRSDLENRKLGLAELAYGSDKAKDLFQDMMQQASSELGFEVNNLPLMIEAIPVSMDCLILVITRVDDPEEFEERLPNMSNILHLDEDEDFEDDLDDDQEIFDEESNYAYDIDQNPDVDDMSAEPLPFNDNPANSEDIIHFGADGMEEDQDDDLPPRPFDILDMFSKNLAKAKKEMEKKKSETDSLPSDIRIYCFDYLDDIISLSSSITSFFKGDSQLYKDESENCYYLILKKGDSSKQDFARADILCSDYGDLIKSGYATLNFFAEHFKPIFKEDALQYLKQLA